MVVKYTDIRTNVIQKLVEESSNLETILTDLSTVVNDIIDYKYLSGQTSVGYIDEFNNKVSTKFSSINANVAAIAEKLESICATYETLDQETNAAIS